MAKEFLVGKAAASEYGLDDWMFNSFSDIVNFYSQQKQSLIASRFPIKTFRGKSTTIQGVKETNVKKRIRTEYKGETPDMTISRDRRWIFPELFEWGKLYNDVEDIQSIVDPKSSDMQDVLYAFRRQYDEQAVASFKRDVISGETGTDVIKWDDKQTMNADLSIDNFDSDTLRMVRGHFKRNHVDLNDPQNQLYFVVSQDEVDKLFQDDRYLNILYNAQKVLPSGRLLPYMGFNFIEYEYLPDSVKEGGRSCFAFCHSGMYWGKQEGADKTRLAERGDRRFQIQAYQARNGNGVRVEEAKVVEWCSKKQTPTKDVKIGK